MSDEGATAGTGGHQGHIHPRRIDVTDEIVAQLVEAFNDIGGSSWWLAAATCQLLRTLAPVRPTALTDDEKKFFLESGEMTEQELLMTLSDLDDGALQLSSIQSWVAEAHDSLSVEDAAAFLEWTDDEVTDAVTSQRLHAIEIAGQLRFPAWQFSLRSPGKLLPHLADVIPLLEAKWRSSVTISRYMATRQEDLVEEGRMTPAGWLEDGHDPEEVKAHIENSGVWW